MPSKPLGDDGLVNVSHPSRTLGPMSEKEKNPPVVPTDARDRATIFDDPVGYLASLGLEAILIGEPGLPAAA